MTFEDIFAGRITLIRSARHICQAGLVGFDHTSPIFRSPDSEQAFRIVERLLTELEIECAQKKVDQRKKVRARKLKARS